MREDDAMQSPSGDEVPLDLSALGVDQDAREREALVARIMAAAAPELKRRGSGVVPIRGGAGALGVLSQWTRPIQAARAVVGLLSTGVLQWSPGVGSGAGAEAVAVAEGDPALLPEVLGLPTTVATWLDEGRAPTTMELVLAMEEGEGW